MRAPARWFTVVVLLAVALVATAPPVWAVTTTCSFVGGIVTISTDSNGNNGQFIRVARSGQLVLVVQHDETGEHVVECGSPNLGDVLKVDYTGAAPSADLEIDERAGPFVTSSGQEVLFDVHMPAGDTAYSTVAVHGDRSGARIVAGANGIDLHNDGDVDVTMSEVDSLAFVGSPNADTLSANGGGSRGGPYTSRVVLFGHEGNDTLRGGSVGDLLLGGEGADVMYGGSGNDALGPVLTLHNAFDANGKGNDRLYGEAGNDDLAGGEHNDVLDGGTGADTMKGMSGVDTVSYAASPSRVSVRLDGTANDGRTINGSSEGDNVVSTVENVNGSPYADSITGNGAANRFSGGGGNDTLLGADGNDTLSGQDGNDALNGGAHTDTCYGGRGTDTVKACEKP